MRLAILLAVLFFSSFGMANTNEVLWGEPAGGMMLGIQVAPEEFAIHCWVKNADSHSIAYNDFYFGYFEDVQLEVRQSDKWNSCRPTLYPMGPGYSSAGAIAGVKVELAPNEAVTQTWTRRCAISTDRWSPRVKALSQAAHNDTFLVDLVSSLPTELLSLTSLEVRVVQKFRCLSNAETQFILHSPAYTFKGSQLKSVLSRKQADGAANGSQPIRSGTNSTSGAAGSRR